MPEDYYDDVDDRQSYKKTVALCVAAASMVVLLFLVVLYVNTDNKRKREEAAAKAQEALMEEQQENEDFMTNSHNFTSDELDFWDDVKSNAITPIPEPNDEEGQLTDFKSGDVISPENNTDDSEAENAEGNLVKDDSDADDELDDNHISVLDENGNKRYYEILSDVPKNDYDFDNNLISENGVVSYKDDRVESVKGVDLSKYDGTIDWNKLKDSGVRFVMLRLGSRGYGTGLITLDEKFVEYAQNAAVSGISVGVYFESSAITEAEAVEEANYVVGAIGSFNVKYPIAIDIQRVTNDESRTDNLTVKDRTAIVKAFCDSVKNYGYKPVVFADRAMLIAGLNIEDLTSYDVWIADSKVPTDYPYKFSLWQYSTRGKIDGINGDANLDISFVDYDRR